MTYGKFTLIIAVTLVLILTVNIYYQFNEGYWYIIDFDKASNYGTLLGGVLSFLSIVLIYLTFEHQTTFTQKAQFESRLFELIRYHRDNVSETKLRCPESTEEVYHEGRKAMREIHKQVIIITRELKDVRKSLDSGYGLLPVEDRKHKDIELEGRIITQSKADFYNVAYLSVFYGFSEEGIEWLRHYLSKRYTANIINKVTKTLENQYAKWQRSEEGEEKDTNMAMTLKGEVKKTKRFGGHQYRLGHFFRHLYHIVNYIDNQEFLTYLEKYEYVKILRAQLSTYEQSLLFFNSISIHGRSWELEVPTLGIKENKLMDYKKYKSLITKYNLVRNIPNEFITGIRINEVYPNLVFDKDEDNDDKTKLNTIYSRNLKYFQK